MAPKPLDVVVRGKNETQSTFAEVTRSAEELEAKVTALNKPFDALRGAVAGLAAFMVADFFKKTVEAAVEAEAAWARVSSAVENAGITMSGVHDKLETLFESMTKTSRFSEKDLAGAFATLLNVTNDYKGSVANLGLVANIAIGRQMDLSQAATLVGRVMDGNTSMLKRYGIVLKDDGIAPMEQLRARFKDFAENDSETLGGGLARIANAFEKIEEAIGKAITGGGGGGKGIDGLVERLNNLAEWIENHTTKFDNFVSILERIAHVGLYLNPTWRAIDWMTSPQSAPSGGLFASATNLAFGHGAAATPETVDPKIQAEIDKNARAAALERENQQLLKDAAEIRKLTEGGVPEDPDVRRALDRMKKQGFDPTSGSGELGVRNTLFELQQKGALDRASMAYLNAGGPQAADLTTNPFTSNRPAQTVAEATKTVSGFGRGLRDAFGDGSKYMQDFDERLGKMAGESIPALAQGFEQMFEALARGGNVFKTLGKGLVDMVAQVAAKMSAEEFAQGLAMLARSIWDFLGPNPAAGASATQHFEAAAAFGALAGGASALGGSGGGGGGGGALGTSSFLNQQNATATKKTTTIVIKGGSLINLSDSGQRADFIESLRELAGDGDLNFLFE